MANYAVKPDSQYTITRGGKTVTVYQKIEPDSFIALSDIYNSKGKLVIHKGNPMNSHAKMRTGKALGETIHNTDDITSLLPGIKSAAEQYILATYNQKMADAVVHFYASPWVVWQLLDENIQAWHSGTGVATKTGNHGIIIGGNVDTIAIECVGPSAEAEETAAILAAYLADKHGFEVDDIYTHNFWSGKICPVWILPHWDKFKSVVSSYMLTKPSGSTTPVVTTPTTTTPATSTAPLKTSNGLSVGDAVSVIANSQWVNNAKVASFVYNAKMYVTNIYSDDSVLISTVKGGATTGRIKADRLIVYGTTYPVSTSTSSDTSTQTKTTTSPKVYTKNGLQLIIPNNSKIVYWDKTKKDAPYENYINAGFFAYYNATVNGSKTYFTLPVANLLCDIDSTSYGIKYLKEWTNGKGIVNGKLTITGNQNGSKQFANRKIATFIIGANQAYVSNTDNIPNGSKYAVSGVPVIINNTPTNWNKGALPQGWVAANVYATYRNFIGVKGGEVVIVSGKTSTENYILTGEIYTKLKGEGITDLISVDGGGSFFCKIGNTKYATGENRQVNNLLVFE